MANSEGSMTLWLSDGARRRFLCTRGLNRVFVRLPGAGDAINVRANTAALSVCIASGPSENRTVLTESPVRRWIRRLMRAKHGSNVFRELLPDLLPDDDKEFPAVGSPTNSSR